MIDTGDGLILIDPGYSNALYIVVHSIYELGFNPKDIKYIINTHWHKDNLIMTVAERITAIHYIDYRKKSRCLYRQPRLE